MSPFFRNRSEGVKESRQVRGFALPREGEARWQGCGGSRRRHGPERNEYEYERPNATAQPRPLPVAWRLFRIVLVLVRVLVLDFLLLLLLPPPPLPKGEAARRAPGRG